ncbi:hypothetical protein RJ639_011277 [Escallonia herrerae]|uniref:Uncharacterized protein n=1 Tax=Escallonia herrerae TaxID=1293975 RepID=A0AA88VN44_9ASTE|nr:hypothetical protein RJ639_011277 [Escallonia herrerae]
MPSVNWREAADNWFGACCCSFGGISEKLVTRYANSSTSAKGMCLLSTTPVVVCKDDLLGCPFPNSDGSAKWEPEHDFAGEHSLSKGMLGSGNILATTVSSDNLRSDDFDGLCAVAKKVSSKVEDEVNGKAPDGERLSYASISSAKDPKSTTTTGIPGDQKSFLNGFLGNAFMARSSNISKEVQWTEFLCPQCSCLLGAYPCANGNSPLDGGVRFFKSYISTCLPVGGSDDLFRDLQSKRPVLQIVLLNPDSWCCSGDCSTMEPKIDMYPSVKVLFSDCCDSTEVQLSPTWSLTARQLDSCMNRDTGIQTSLGGAKNLILCPSLQKLDISTVMQENYCHLLTSRRLFLVSFDEKEASVIIMLCAAVG